MTCRETLNLLPLFVGRDLERGREESLSTHLRTCGACRAEERLFRRTGEILAATEPVFDSAERNAFRRAVLDRVSLERPRPSLFGSFSFPRPAFALAALAVALAAGVALLSPRLVRDAREMPSTETPIRGGAGEGQTARGEVPVASTAVRPPVVRPRRVAASAPLAPVRIEIQTTDVNVRIIWFGATAPDGPSAAAPVENQLVESPVTE